MSQKRIQKGCLPEIETSVGYLQAPGTTSDPGKHTSDKLPQNLAQIPPEFGAEYLQGCRMGSDMPSERSSSAFPFPQVRSRNSDMMKFGPKDVSVSDGNCNQTKEKRSRRHKCSADRERALHQYGKGGKRSVPKDTVRSVGINMKRFDPMQQTVINQIPLCIPGIKNVHNVFKSTSGTDVMGNMFGVIPKDGQNALSPFALARNPQFVPQPLLFGTFPMGVQLISPILKHPSEYGKRGKAPPDSMNRRRLLVSQQLNGKIQNLSSSSSLDYEGLMLRLEQISSNLEKIGLATEKVRFAVPTIFRVRNKYILRSKELEVLYNVESVYRYLLFLHLLKGFNEFIPLDFKKDSRNDKIGAWEKGSFMKFCNDSNDCCVIDFANFPRFFRDNCYEYNPEWVVTSWNTPPSLAFMKFEVKSPLFDIAGRQRLPIINRTHLVVIRAINVSVLLDNVEALKVLCATSVELEDLILETLGYYCLTCDDEGYLLVVSSVLPLFGKYQVVKFYVKIARLLDSEFYNIQGFYLERFLERILPICLSDDMKAWSYTIKTLMKIIDPLRLGVKHKCTGYAMIMLRTLKSYCNIFTKCESACLAVFNKCLQLILQASDDSRILIRGDATDLAMQIWLNENGKKVVTNSMGYDTVRILGCICGVQSIKLNIWPDLFSILSDEMTTTLGSVVVGLDKGDVLSDSSKSMSINNMKNGCTKHVNLLSLMLSTADDFSTIAELISHKEGSFLCSILNCDSFSSYCLFWYFNKYLRITKTSIALEKVSIVIRFVLACYPKLIKLKLLTEMDKVLNDCFSFARILTGTSVLGPFVCWMLNVSTNVGVGSGCLELANIKMAIFIDWLFYGYGYNSWLSQNLLQGTDHMVKIFHPLSDHSRGFLNTCTYSRDIIRHFLGPILCLQLVNTKKSDSSPQSESGNIKGGFLLDYILENSRSVFNLERNTENVTENGSSNLKLGLFDFDGDQRGLLSGSCNKMWNMVEERGTTYVFGAGEILAFALSNNDNNVDLGRRLVDYMLNAIWYYHSEEPHVLALDVIASMFTVTLMVLLSLKSTIDSLPSLLRELKRTIMGRICQVADINLEMFTVRVKKIPKDPTSNMAQIILNKDKKTDLLDPSFASKGEEYTKIVALTESRREQYCYDGLLKYLIMQSYTLILEFYLNFDLFIQELNNCSILSKHPMLAACDPSKACNYECPMIYTNISEDLGSNNVINEAGYTEKSDENDEASDVTSEDSDDGTVVVDDVTKLILDIVDDHCMNIQSKTNFTILIRYIRFNLQGGSFPDYTVNCNYSKVMDNYNDTSDANNMINSIKFELKSPQNSFNSAVEIQNEYKIADVIDTIASYLLLSAYKQRNFQSIYEEKKSLFPLPKDRTGFFNIWIDIFLKLSIKSLDICWELLYYIAALTVSLKSNFRKLEAQVKVENDTYVKKITACGGDFIRCKISVITALFLNLVRAISTEKKYSEDKIINNILKNCLDKSLKTGLKQVNDQQTVEFACSVQKLMPIRFALEQFVHDEFQWHYFKWFPSILANLIKVSPNPSLLCFLSSFSSLGIVNDTGYMLGMCTHLDFNIFSHDLDTNKEWDYIKRLLLTDIKASEPVSFRQYFISWQLIARMYEMSFSTAKMQKTLKQSRYFLDSVTTPLVAPEQLGNIEYLTRDLIFYFLGTNNISGDKRCICFLGSSKTRSNFVAYSKGYTLLRASGDFFVSKKLWLLTAALLEIVKRRNTQMTQVALFSIFPILIHSIPTHAVFEHILKSLEILSKFSQDFGFSMASGFLRHMLVVIILHWLYRHNEQIENFTSKEEAHCIGWRGFVEEVLDKYTNDLKCISFTFNNTAVIIPVEFAHLAFHIIA